MSEQYVHKDASKGPSASDTLTINIKIEDVAIVRDKNGKVVDQITERTKEKTLVACFFDYTA